MLAVERQRTGRPRQTGLREVASAIAYRWKTGCPWRMLPHDFPPWGTVYTYFREWERAGILPELKSLLRNRGRVPTLARRHDRRASESAWD
ncbi:MAG: transposase [Planctomycetaceae bacterium]|nr:transposase [Planctomycetaceae bacterium]